MANKCEAQIFRSGGSQAVRLPSAFRLPSDRVRVRRKADGILLQPIITDVDSWFAAMDRCTDIPFFSDSDPNCRDWTRKHK